MSSTPRPGVKKGRLVALQFFLEALCILGIVALGFWVWSATQTQHQICQLVHYAGIQNQNSIETNSALVEHDVKLNTPAAKADAKIRRVTIKKATDAQIIINRIRC